MQDTGWRIRAEIQLASIGLHNQETQVVMEKVGEEELASEEHSNVQVRRSGMVNELMDFSGDWCTQISSPSLPLPPS